MSIFSVALCSGRLAGGQDLYNKALNPQTVYPTRPGNLGIACSNKL